jgi:hypothetical protein
MLLTSTIDVLTKMQPSGILYVPLSNYVSSMLASEKIVDVNDILDKKLAIEKWINVNVDAKLVVDPCKDKKITDFVGQDMNKIRFEQAKLIKR